MNPDEIGIPRTTLLAGIAGLVTFAGALLKLIHHLQSKALKDSEARNSQKIAVINAKDQVISDKDTEIRRLNEELAKQDERHRAELAAALAQHRAELFAAQELHRNDLRNWLRRQRGEPMPPDETSTT